MLTKKCFDADGNRTQNKALTRFNKAVTEKLAELGHSDTDNATKLYHDLSIAIKHAVDTTLPEVTRRTRQKRAVSEATKKLYEERSKGKKRTSHEFEVLQARIKKAGLDDFKSWVEGQGEEMAQANARGDTKAIYDVVNTLKGKGEKPAKNLTTNGQGEMLSCADDVAKRWYGFLSEKFSATEKEMEDRHPMKSLPSTQGMDLLTEEEILNELSKMQSNKACGPDEVPIRSL